MIFIYTFRTFPWIEELQTIFSLQPERLPHEIFVFGKLKEDLEKFCEMVKADKPELIIGIAKGKVSRWEGEAVDQFHKRKIVKNGVKKYSLYTPEGLGDSFPISLKPTTTFCNWTMYKIQEFLIENNLQTNFCFAHVNRSGLTRMGDILSTQS